MTTEPWVDRYRPETIKDVQGNNTDLDTITEWADDWSPGDDPILLVGPPGVGKTSTAEAVANRLGVQTVEVNASSARRTEDLESIAAQIRTTGEHGRRLILIDEVDSWHHGPDKTVLYDALDAPSNPVIMTANEEHDVAGGLKSRAETFEFSLRKSSRRAKLNDIVDAEDLEISDDEIDRLADRPDLRSAINDLQMYAESEGPVSADAREWETSEWDMIDDVLTGTPEIGSVRPPWALLWLDECTSAEYRGLEMAMAYEALSRADLQLARAGGGDYRPWKFARALLEEVALIRETEPYYGDEISYNNKSFPAWAQHSAPNATGDSEEARLYRALKKPDSSGLEFAGSYVMFLNVYLPILQDLSDEEKYELIQHYRLDPQEYTALGVSKSEYEDWIEVEEPESGEWTPNVQDASEW